MFSVLPSTIGLRIIGTRWVLTRLRFMENLRPSASRNTFFTASAKSSPGGDGNSSKRFETRHTPRSRGHGVDDSADNTKIQALGRLLTRILRHMAFELKLNMRNDGYVKVEELLRLNLKTYANIPLQSHTVNDVQMAVKNDNKGRFSMVEENGELLIRANQGHTIETVKTESLLRPILSPEDIPVCVHGTYKRNLESILRDGLKRMKRLHVHFSSGLPSDGEVISGMRKDVNVVIFLNVKKAMEEGMKLYISDNRVILTEGFDGVVPVKYFQRIESWPKREPIPFQGRLDESLIESMQALCLDFPIKRC